MKKYLILTLLLQFSETLCFSQAKITPEFLWKLGRVSDPHLSPDGKTVLYSVKYYNLQENNGNSDIYTIPVSGGEGKNLTHSSENESAAIWSSDGLKIYYLNDKGGSSQIWVMNADGSGASQIAEIDGDVGNFEIAPSGNMIWVTMETKVDKSLQDLYPDLPKATGRIYDDLMYRHWTTWEDGFYSHVFVAGFANGKVSGDWKDIMKGERFDTPLQPLGGGEQVSWRPDGKQLAYTCKKLAGKEYATSTNSDIYLYDTESGTTTNLTEGMNGYDINPRYSPDGSKLFWQSMETPKYEADRNRLFIYDFKTKTKTELTKGFDYSVESAQWSPDGKMIYFISGINATDQLWSLEPNPIKKFPIKQITTDVGDYTAFTLAGMGKNTMAVSSMMSILTPAELFKINLATGVSSQLTFTNKDQLSKVKMATMEKRMIKATDGKEILTWIIYPPDFDRSKKYPALLYCQGGPQSTVSQFFSYRWNFQLMAANGYIIVAPNRRGLPSFGTEWNREISGDWGGQAMNDLLSAIDDVSKESFVDKEKLGAVGASFGGYSVYWLMGHHNHRFKTFIAHCGVFNLESMYGTTEELWFPDFDTGGPYWLNPVPKSYEAFSPHHFVKNWDTPLLVIHNEKDFRVPLGQGMEAFTAARLKNIPARFLCFPDEGHWVSKPQNSVLWQRVFFDWLGRSLK